MPKKKEKIEEDDAFNFSKEVVIGVNSEEEKTRERKTSKKIKREK